MNSNFCTLNLQINVGRINIFTILSLPIYEFSIFSIYLSLIQSPLMKLQSFLCRNLALLKYFLSTWYFLMLHRILKWHVLKGHDLIQLIIFPAQWRTLLNGTGNCKLQDTVVNDTKTTSTVCATALTHVKALAVLPPLSTLSAQMQTQWKTSNNVLWKVFTLWIPKMS